MEQRLKAAPPAESCRRLDFDNAEIHIGIVSGSFLSVSGTKPYANMDVRILPWPEYLLQPEYWAYEVVACLTGMGLPVEAPYHETIEIRSVGTKGIDVVGATSSKRFDGVS